MAALRSFWCLNSAKIVEMDWKQILLKMLVVIALGVTGLGNYFVEIPGIQQFMPQRFFT